MAMLQIVSGLKPGQIFPLGGEATILGRNPDCDIVLEPVAVSRHHARIRQIEGRFYVEDLRSRNGTFLNERPVQGRQMLSEDDQLRICDVVLVFHQGAGRGGRPGGDADADDSSAVLIDDERPSGGSTVMSKMKVAPGATGARLEVRPEVKLKALIEIGQNLGSALAVADVLPKLLDSLFAIFPQADRGFVVLKDRTSDRLVVKAVKHRRAAQAETVRISRTIVSEVMAAGEAILSADAAADSRFDMAESIVDFHIRSMMCAPLVSSEGQPLGVIQIDALDPRNRFNQQDLDVLASVAGQIAVAVENAQLHEAALRQQALERELILAHEVQQGFLPAEPPQIEGYTFFDFYEPASRLGGDFYDYVPVSDGRLAIVLADVSGKGVSAALLVAKLSAEIRHCLATEATPADAMRKLNDAFCSSRWESRFVTMSLVVLDLRRHELAVVSAGHMPPLLRTSSGIREVIDASVSGLPLGVAENHVYAQSVVSLSPGDHLITYTDGITEAMNGQDELYGLARLRAQLEPEIDAASTLGWRIIDDVKRFVGRHPQSDDMCLTCFGRTQ